MTDEARNDDAARIVDDDFRRDAEAAGLTIEEALRRARRFWERSEMRDFRIVQPEAPEPDAPPFEIPPQRPI